MVGLNLDSLGDSKFIKKDSAAWSDAFKCLGFGAGENENFLNFLVPSIHCI
jgi:hypothetical protein